MVRKGDWGGARFVDWEDTLEKEMATHSSILAWEIPWTEEPGGLQSMGCRVRCDLVTKQQQIYCNFQLNVRTVCDFIQLK